MRSRPNICMIGYGMMGVWHSEGLKGFDCVLHTAVGPRAEKVAAFAAQYGYRNHTTDLAAALKDPEIDIVVIGSPTEVHHEQALAAIDAGKATLVEIPIAMSLAQSEEVVARAQKKGVPLGVVHPMRFRAERQPVVARIRKGEERVSHIHGRFFIHRLVNIGATGYKRSWVDNILWHHSAHLVDLGLWMLCGGDMRTADQRIRRVQSVYPPADERTGIPMEVVIVAETHDNQTVTVMGSYYSKARLYETLVVTDRDTYGFDELAGTLTTSAGTAQIISEQRNAELVAQDFINAVRDGREPHCPGWSVLPAMRILEAVQNEWDGKYGRQALPGRPL
jgi:2-hydroxy-4-carboxymuconate semialdehyde hemiacetal dehydrogenase